MAQSKNSFLSALASSVTSSGTVPAAALAPEVTADIEGAGTAVYDSASLLPIVGNTAGDTAFVKSTSRLYIHSGIGWYNVAVINNTPTVQSITDSDGGTTPFALATDGTPTTITITAQDSDGDPLTYNYSADSNFAGLATLSQDANVFTITPFSSDSATTTSGTITFTVTDGINTATPGTQTFTLNFVSALWDETVLSIGTSSTNSLDNSTFIDRSTNAHTVTPTGSPVQTVFHPYLDNWSMEVSGSEWIQTISSQSAFDFSDDGDFTIEMWVKDNLSTDGVRTIMNMKSGTYGFLFRRHSSNRWELYYNGTSAAYLNIADYGGLTDWYHMAITHSSGTLRWFVNGTEGFTTTSINTSNYNFTTLDLASYAGYNWNGYFSNVRVVKGTALYTSDFTPPTEKLTAVSGTTFLGYQSNRFIDNSGNNEQITIGAGDPKISAFNPFGQGSEYAVGENKGSVSLDGTNDYLTPSSTLVPATGDFTLECWLNMNATSDRSDLYSQYLVSNAGRFDIFIESNVLTVFLGTAVLTSSAIKSNQWQHFALTRSGSSFVLYLDGVSAGTGSNATSIYQSNPYIGYQDYNGGALDGYISDFKISNTVVYTSAFTPPTAPVGNTNASLYLPMDNAGIFDKTGLNTLTTVGNASTSTTQTKYADTSLELVSTTSATDYLVIPESDLPSFGTNDFTIEFWMYPNSTSTSWGLTSSATILDTDAAAGSGADWWAIHQNNAAIQLATNSANLITTSSALTALTWQHVAIVRSGSTITVYIDGTSVGTATQGTTIGGTRKLYIGQQNGYSRWFKGYLENIQILKGVAKYTTNFTVPNEEQGRAYQAED